MIWPIKRVSFWALSGDLAHPYLANDYAAKADYHSLAGNLTVHHEVPALIEHFKELA
jgi:hypothetical protein